MSERTDEREPVDYAADARRLLKMLDDRKARAIAVVPANSDCSPSEFQTDGLDESRFPDCGVFRHRKEMTHAIRPGVNVDGSVTDRATGQMTFALHAVKKEGGPEDRRQLPVEGGRGRQDGK